MEQRARKQIGKVFGSLKDVFLAVKPPDAKVPSPSAVAGRGKPDALSQLAEAVRGVFGKIEESLREQAAAQAAPADPVDAAEAPAAPPDPAAKFADLPERLATFSDEAVQRFVSELPAEEWEPAALAMRRASTAELGRFAKLARVVVLGKGGDEAWVTTAAAMGVDPDSP
jgi:hypothetical protein